MNKNEQLTLEITGFGECGLARSDGLVVFVEGTCPGDVARVKVSKVTKNYAGAEVLDIITPSPHRVKPFCAMQKVCGACQIQFIDYNYQLKLKRQKVQDAISRLAGLDIKVKEVIPSPQTREYRHKIQYSVAQTKVSKRLLAGYYKTGTHEIVNIKHCPVQPEICDSIIEFIRNNAVKYGICGYDEKKHTGDLRHIVLRSSAATGQILVTLVINANRTSDSLNSFAGAIYEAFDKAAGVCINFNTAENNVILGPKSVCAAGQDHITERILNKTFQIGANTFFQVNPKSAENIFKYVKNYIRENFENPVVLDAYAGIAAFGICVSDVCRKVVCVEENPQSCELARISAALNSNFDMNFNNDTDLKVKNVMNFNNNIDLKARNDIQIHNEDAQKYMESLQEEFDAVIVDPPRRGCSKEALDEVLRLCRGKIIYVSCNPATLARDLKYLAEKGAKVESIRPFDLFCHTTNVETVAVVGVARNDV